MCFDYSVPISTTTGCIGITGQRLSPYNIGSFYRNKKKLYDLVASKAIHFTASGHSHRAGAYSLGSTSSQVISHTEGTTKALTRVSGIARNSAAEGCTGKEIYVDTHNILVCGSSGTYCKQSYDGELLGQGKDYPQGFVLHMGRYLGGSKDPSLTDPSLPATQNPPRVVWIKDKRVKPRMASVVEYLWYQKDCSPFGVRATQEGRGIHKIGSAKEGEFFCYSINQNFLDVFHGENIISSISLFALNATQGTVLRMYP